ncbi:unnamed protein product, partial [Iphiclides podalirius]
MLHSRNITVRLSNHEHFDLYLDVKILDGCITSTDASQSCPAPSINTKRTHQTSISASPSLRLFAERRRAQKDRDCALTGSLNRLMAPERTHTYLGARLGR